MRIELSTRAAADLRNLYLQGAEDFGILQAENYLATLEDSLRLIGEFPYAGTAGNSTDPTLRAYSVKSHRILYRIRDGSVPLIIRILHARQLPPELA
ncbi:plasmid stabilization system [Glycocaulis alkaliphilus]|uniref:Plasmid stabilization system n=1 Tax=Glycocaulis alkaliphilus TaxID=1434191 RepID=A0A3T0E8G8_9PROT|nr:type II toxin-antitoxin system RelE/ParE family toxin [Glycocaulis alkaliphilus]AZU03691.1 plasmid stabilization system [Glycocaulis alkaliphilus]